MTADLQDLFDQAGRNPPTRALDADAVLHRARRSRNRRRTTGAVAATVAVTLALVVGLASQRRQSADPDPSAPVPTVQALGSLGSLAYGIDGDIYVAEDGREPLRIADGAPSEAGDCGGYWGEGPIWSPDGRYLAYRGDGGEASPESDFSCDRTVNISDSTGHHIASFAGDGWAIAWSPDSTRVAAWVDFYGDAKLEIYGLDGVRQALLTMPPGWRASGDFDPVWSPDGASLLVRGGVEVPVDGSTPRRLPAGDPRSQLTVKYSPDGGEIAYISRDGLGVAAADGSQARVLIPGGPKDFPFTPSGLVWSPTGDRIAFVQATGEQTEEMGPGTELAVLDLASGSVVPLADMGGAYTFKSIQFSPEGDQILFTRTDATGASSLWSVHADGSDPHQLVAGTGWGDWQTVPTP